MHRVPRFVTTDNNKTGEVISIGVNARGKFSLGERARDKQTVQGTEAATFIELVNRSKPGISRHDTPLPWHSESDVRLQRIHQADAAH